MRFVLLLTLACHPSPRPTPLDAAEGLYWDVFSTHRYDRIAEARAALERAVAEHPDRARPHLLLGTLLVWKHAKPGLPGLSAPPTDSTPARVHPGPPATRGPTIRPTV